MFTIIYTGLAIACLSYPGNLDTSGAYELETKNIYICTKRDQEEQDRALVHEIGHWVWYNVYTDLQREEWKQLWLKIDIHNPLPLYDGVIGAGIEEDFAIMFENVYYYKYVPPLYDDLASHIKLTIKSFKK